MHSSILKTDQQRMQSVGAMSVASGGRGTGQNPNRRERDNSINSSLDMKNINITQSSI
jgi:hypothetical protein